MCRAIFGVVPEPCELNEAYNTMVSPLDTHHPTVESFYDAVEGCCYICRIVEKHFPVHVTAQDGPTTMYQLFKNGNGTYTVFVRLNVNDLRTAFYFGVTQGKKARQAFLFPRIDRSQNCFSE